MASEETIKQNKERFENLCSSITRPGIENLMRWLDASDFYTAPASSRYHGAEPGGLCMHSLNVYDQLKRLLAAYPEIEISEESVLIASLFHDLCKVNFYKTEQRNRKNEFGVWEKYDAYTVSERFHFGGHGSKSVFLIQNFMKLTAEEAVAINCHMGFSDNEHVSDSYEQYPFALLVAWADQAAAFIIETRAEAE